MKNAVGSFTTSGLNKYVLISPAPSPGYMRAFTDQLFPNASLVYTTGLDSGGEGPVVIARTLLMPSEAHSIMEESGIGNDLYGNRFKGDTWLPELTEKGNIRLMSGRLS